MAKYSPPKGYYWASYTEYREGYGAYFHVLELRKKLWGFLPGKTVYSRYLVPEGSTELEISEAVARVASSILKEQAQIGTKEIMEMLR